MNFLNTPSFIAFRSLDFRRFLFFKFMLTLALQVQFVVLSWQVYQLTKDYLSLGLLGLSEAIPAVGLALFGGHFADRYDRRKILIAVIFLQVLTSSALFFINRTLGDALPGTVSVLPFYIIMFLIGLLRSFYSPAQFSLMTQVVPREAYANSSAWNSTIWHIGVVAGSAGGGLLLGFFGKDFSYGFVIVCLLLGLFQILRMSGQPVKHAIREESMGESIKRGLKFVFGNQMIFGALLLDLIAVLFGGAVAMLPVFASEVLHVGEKGFGFLRAAPFFGSVIMALYMTKHPPLKNAGKKLFICVSGYALCMILFALSTNFILSLLILALSGCFDNVSVVIRSTILQVFTPDDMRGRVSSVSTMFISSSNEIGEFESGFAAKIMGLIPSVIFGGGVALGSVFTCVLSMSKLRKLDLEKEMDKNK